MRTARCAAASISQAFDDDVDLVVGEELPMRLADSPRLKVMSFDAQRVKLDANHPLAGEDLTFELTLIEII